MSKIVLSCDDACASDVRVAELCKKYGTKCTFYWPVEWHSLAHQNGYKPLTLSEALDIAEEFEIGSHTIAHRQLTRITPQEARYEIRESKYILEKLFNKEIESFAPPRGYTNPELTEYTLRRYAKQRLTKGEGLVHVHPNSGANENKHWLERAKEVEVKELFCHSHELDKYDLWKELEKYLEDSSS